MESNITPNITRPSDSFSTVPTIVDGGDWGCIVRDLETIIVLVLLANQKEDYHSLISIIKKKYFFGAGLTIGQLTIRDPEWFEKMCHSANPTTEPVVELVG